MTTAPSDGEIDEAIGHFRAHGWARLGVLADEAIVDGLRKRADAIMTGEVVHDGLFFQHDSETGRYEDLPYGEGWQGPSLRYRKVEKLERDPLFLSWITADVFRRIAARVYADADVALYRAFLMNKHAGGGSPLPWHQDGGDFWGLDRDPLLTIWTALDDAPLDGGCVVVLPDSHLAGLVTKNGGVVPRDHVVRRSADRDARPLPARAGEVLLLHNHVWHRSGPTRTGLARRALSVCYMDGATRCLRKKRAPRTFVRVFPRAIDGECQRPASQSA
jgi:phytanoyl-CoA hydroxylase